MARIALCGAGIPIPRGMRSEWKRPPWACAAGEGQVTL